MVAIIDELAQNGTAAYFGAGACPGSPRSFIMDEKRDKCEGLEPPARFTSLKATYPSSLT